MASDGKPVEKLFDNYKVLTYSGQIGIVIDHSQVTKAVEAFEWSGGAEFKKTPRKIRKVGDEVIYYYESYLKILTNFPSFPNVQNS
ncbi:unnamed protein product [Allacma fusca]|uniref:Uncharacterized protein n=1 Tax=Allacma fusca TaxID=39272 RepID=A0A8J2JVP0_9HEXA|nr:unnamed protein product [Allacma fusca]